MSASSLIKRFSYDYELSELLVEFTSGAHVYIYEHVPVEVYEAWDKAESKGKFFGTMIRGQYPFRKAKIEQESETHGEEQSSFETKE
jgi:hypothetical protein